MEAQIKRKNTSKNVKKSNRNNKRKKIDKYVGRRMAALFIIVVLILIVINLIFGNDKEKINDLKILYNNEETKYADVIVDSEDRIYFSIFDITNIFDSNLYYNDAEKEIITTFNKHVALLKVDETFMVVNDSNINLSAEVKEFNNTVYIPITDMELVYDIEVSYSEEENVLMLDSIDEAKKEAEVVKKTKVKEDRGLFKKTLEKIDVGSIVVVIEELENYYKIRTENGNIGYVKANKLSEVKSVRDDYVVQKLPLNLLTKNTDVKVYENIAFKENHLNVLNPAIINIDSNLKIASNAVVNTDNYSKYVNWADEKNIYVMPTLKNSTSVSECLMTYANRNKIINDLYVFLIKNKAKGVYINFNEIDDVNSFYRFLIELTPKFKESGMYVIVEDNKVLDKHKLETIVDYVVEEK